MKSSLTPNESVSLSTKQWIAVAWLVVVLGGWELFRSPIFPSLIDILKAFPVLWGRDGLGDALLSSMRVNITALILSTAISLPVAYLSRVPLFEPVSGFLGKLRFLSPSVFFLIFLFLFKDGGKVKLWMLVSGETFFLVTSMVDVVRGIPLAGFDDARTLRMSEWQSLYYVAIRGTLPGALEVIRANAAIGWSMLMMVEGFVRSQGGVGVLLLNQEKYLKFDFVYAIAISIVLVGLLQDFALTYLRKQVCPYAV